MIVINLLGLVACVLALIVGVGIGDRIAGHERHVEMICTGLALAAIDIAYRRLRGVKIIGRGGPAIFWLPAWIWGALMVAAGASLLIEHR
jgi:hypothetical protein